MALSTLRPLKTLVLRTAPAQARRLIRLFDRGKVAIVVDGDRFLGLITRVDFLNHLRRKAA